MPKLPVVAIVGRPNVGKSTLFNRLVGKKLALVDDRPGVTRDRREGDAHLLGLDFRIIDTAGFEDEDAADACPAGCARRPRPRSREADVALFLIDARAGVVPLDEEIARWLRGSRRRRSCSLANKAEGRAGEQGIIEALALGFGDPVPALRRAWRGHGRPVRGAAAAIIERRGRARRSEDDESPDAPLKLAIVGRPNAGKSTLVNRMLGEDRLITGPEAGITRDSIAIDWEWHDPEGGDRARSG